MDLETIINAIQSLGAVGPNGVIALLVLIIFALLSERKRLVEEITKKDDKTDAIIDDYYKGNLTLSEALNSLKTVLYEIKIKI